MKFQFHVFFAVIVLATLGACASIPPGADFPKHVSTAMVHPEQTPLGRKFQDAAHEHNGNSGFRIVPTGTDGFLLRIQMINAAVRTLDIQYFIFRGDDTGKLITEAVLHAADRGVRIRVLVDDGETVAGDDQITEIAAHNSVEIRIFNPFAYRGHSKALRAIEFMTDASRLDYRMHNKLLIVDNSVALIGGRNLGDEYFQIDPDGQFADDDVFAAGPVAQRLSATFDEFWNSALSIPCEALTGDKSSRADLHLHREVLQDDHRQLKAEGVDYVNRITSGEPFNSVLSGRLPLIWAPAQVVYDSPDKKKVDTGERVGKLMRQEVGKVAVEVQSELLIVTPYLIPGDKGMRMLKGLRQRNIRVRILTSSLESSTVLVAQSGYMQYRVPMLESGIELYEIRSLLGNTIGSGETKAISRYGNYSLHAKLFVFDRKSLFIGSMNFDQRSMHLNTEIGLIIDSPELARQIAARFDSMVQPVNAYALALIPGKPGSSPNLVWRTREYGKDVEYVTEPARSDWQRNEVKMLSLLPLGDEL